MTSSDPEVRRRKSEATKRAWADPAERKRRSEAIKIALADPGVRKRRSESMLRRLGATEIKHVAFVQRDFMDAYKRYEQIEMVRLALPEEVKPDFKRLTEKSAMLPARQISEQVYAEPLAPRPRSAVVNTKEQLRQQIEEIRANRGDATRVLTAKATACRPITARTPTVSQFLCQPKTTRADRRR